MTWSESLQMSAWAADGKKVSSTYSFTVDSSVATAVQFQFYRNPSISLDAKTWEEMEKLVTVSFAEKGR